MDRAGNSYKEHLDLAAAPQPFGKTWGLVLAAGDGTRLRGVTSTNEGEHVPKQYWSLKGGETLLQETLRRGAALADADSLCVVVAREHSRWWKPEVAGLHPANVFSQPMNRGTAIGILMPLLHIAERDPEARVVILPADHYIADEAALGAGMRRALSIVEAGAYRTMLLGVEPTSRDHELGLLLTEGRDEGNGALLKRMVEKPAWEVAERLFSQRALWNMFIVVAEVGALLHLIRRQHPLAVELLEIAQRHARESAAGSTALDAVYRVLPSIDFSADVIAGQESRVGVVQVPPCGWSDLGTQERVVSVLRQPGNRPPPVRRWIQEDPMERSLLRRCNTFIHSLALDR